MFICSFFRFLGDKMGKMQYNEETGEVSYMPKVFHHTSNECYNWLKQQPHVKEESLTDWLLYTVSKQTNRIYYKSFSRNEESLNGADWEWWILTNTNKDLYAYRFLVQAKKLKRDCDNYPLISYGNRNGLQIDLLLQAAKNRNAMPLYLYYSCSKPNLKEQLKNINFLDSRIITWCETCINGAYLSMAHSIKKKVFGSPRVDITDVELLNNSLALSTCDILFGDLHDIRTLLQNLNHQYITLENIDIYKCHGAFGIMHNENAFPNYLKTLIKRKNEDLDWMDYEYRHGLNGISGVAVIDLRTTDY